MALYCLFFCIFWKTSYKQRALNLQKKMQLQFWETISWKRKQEYEEGIDTAQVAVL